MTDTDTKLLSFLARYLSNETPIYWYHLRFLTQEELMPYESPLKVLEALADKGYLKEIDDKPGYYLFTPQGKSFISS
jgi:hypothetical protein